MAPRDMSPFAFVNTGRYITCDKDDAFRGYWAGPERVSGVIECALKSGQFVAGVRFHGEDVSFVTAASFMRNTTSWSWATSDFSAPRDDDLPTLNGIKHERSMQRAYDIAPLIVERVAQQNLKGKYIDILDGNGENRRAMESAFDDPDPGRRPPDSHHPRTEPKCRPGQRVSIRTQTRAAHLGRLSHAAQARRCLRHRARNLA